MSDGVVGSGAAPAEAGQADPDGTALMPPWLLQIIRDEGRLTLTDYETGRLLGISRGSVRQAIVEGDLCHLRLGRRLLVPLIPLLQMMRVEVSVVSGVADEAS